MFRYLLTFITNLLFLVPLTVSRFRKANPETPVLVAGAVKAVKAGTTSLERGPQWIASRRGTLIATPAALICGDWSIPLQEVQTADLFNIRGGQVLAVTCHDGSIYQFGLSPDPGWETRLPLPLRVSKAKVKLSLFSLLLRIWLVISLPLIIWVLLSK